MSERALAYSRARPSTYIFHLEIHPHRSAIFHQPPIGQLIIARARERYECVLEIPGANSRVIKILVDSLRCLTYRDADTVSTRRAAPPSRAISTDTLTNRCCFSATGRRSEAVKRFYDARDTRRARGGMSSGKISVLKGEEPRRTVIVINA